jgi:hypothetical protein
MTIWTRLTALGFAIGSAAHALGLVLLLRGIQWYGPGYPAWRHAVMALVDLSIVWIGLRRTSWFVFALFAFFVEQQVVNGFHFENALVIAATVFAAREKWFMEPSPGSRVRKTQSPS